MPIVSKKGNRMKVIHIAITVRRYSVLLVIYYIANLRRFIKPEDQWSCKRSPDILAYYSTKHTKPGKYMVKK